mgnify:CR=1 FL=1
MDTLRRYAAIAGSALALERLRPKLCPRTADELAFLPAALEIVETPPSPLGRAIAGTIMLFLTIAVAWASLGELDIHATAQGQIIPRGKTKIVQPPEPGVIKDIHVKDGDRVTMGQVLVTLDRTGSGAHFNMSLADVESGANLFDPGSGEPGAITPLAEQFIAGVLRHAAAICAVIAPTVNSYKRLVAQGSMSGFTWAPVFICCAYLPLVGGWNAAPPTAPATPTWVRR